MNRKSNQSIRCYFSDDVLARLGEKPLSHSYAIFQFPSTPFTSDSKLFSISLTDWFFFFFFSLSKNHNDQSLVQGEHATVILCLNLRANNHNKKFSLLSFEMIRCTNPVWFCTRSDVHFVFLCLQFVFILFGSKCLISFRDSTFHGFGDVLT